MDGFQALGEVIGRKLAGGQGGPSEAYVDAYRQGAMARGAGHDADKKREEARIARAMAVAREAIPESMQTAGYDPQMLPFLSNVLMGNRTMDLGQLEEFRRPGTAPALEAAAEAMALGDLATYNDQMALAQGKFREPFKAVGGGEATLRGDTGEVAITDLGQAAMAADRALAAQREASAGAQGARADLYGRTDPNRPRGGGKAKETPAPPKAGDIVDGYRFKGGDPGNPNSWEKI